MGLQQLLGDLLRIKCVYGECFSRITLYMMQQPREIQIVKLSLPKNSTLPKINKIRRYLAAAFSINRGLTIGEVAYPFYQRNELHLGLETYKHNSRLFVRIERPLLRNTLPIATIIRAITDELKEVGHNGYRDYDILE